MSLLLSGLRTSCTPGYGGTTPLRHRRARLPPPATARPRTCNQGSHQMGTTFSLTKALTKPPTKEENRPPAILPTGPNLDLGSELGFSGIPIITHRKTNSARINQRDSRRQIQLPTSVGFLHQKRTRFRQKLEVGFYDFYILCYCYVLLLLLPLIRRFSQNPTSDPTSDSTEVGFGQAHHFRAP